MKTIPLTQGKYALVDDEDFERLNQHKWYAHRQNNGDYYAVRQSSRKTKQKRHHILMHRFILGLKYGENGIADHRNGDTLDNRKFNLRLATFAQNVYNTAKRKGRVSSKYKGVSWGNQRMYKGKRYKGRWRVHIRYNSKLICLGSFDDEIEAAKAYDAKAKELFGEFARLNNVA